VIGPLADLIEAYVLSRRFSRKLDASLRTNAQNSTKSVPYPGLTLELKRILLITVIKR